MKWMSLLAIAATLCPAAGCGCCSCFRRSEPVPVPAAPYCPPPVPACDPCATGPGVGVPPASAYGAPPTSTYVTPGAANYAPGTTTFSSPTNPTYVPQQPINYNMPAPQM